MTMMNCNLVDLDNPAKIFPNFFIFSKLILVPKNSTKIKCAMKICELLILVSKTILLVIVACMPVH
jgi:hypothetical protein